MTNLPLANRVHSFIDNQVILTTNGKILMTNELSELFNNNQNPLAYPMMTQALIKVYRQFSFILPSWLSFQTVAKHPYQLYPDDGSKLSISARKSFLRNDWSLALDESTDFNVTDEWVEKFGQEVRTSFTEAVNYVSQRIVADPRMIQIYTLMAPHLTRTLDGKLRGTFHAVFAFCDTYSKAFIEMV